MIKGYCKNFETNAMPYECTMLKFWLAILEKLSEIGQWPAVILHSVHAQYRVHVNNSVTTFPLLGLSLMDQICREVSKTIHFNVKWDDHYWTYKHYLFLLVLASTHSQKNSWKNSHQKFGEMHGRTIQCQWLHLYAPLALSTSYERGVVSDTTVASE